MIVVLSPASVASVECRKEVAHGLENNKRLIPIVASDVDAASVPEALRKLNWIFFGATDDFDRGLDALIRAVDTDLEWVDGHTALLGKTVEWSQAGRESSRLLRGRELTDAEAWQVRSAAREPKPTGTDGGIHLASRRAERRRQRSAAVWCQRRFRGCSDTGWDGVAAVPHLALARVGCAGD